MCLCMRMLPWYRHQFKYVTAQKSKGQKKGVETFSANTFRPHCTWACNIWLKCACLYIIKTLLSPVLIFKTCFRAPFLQVLGYGPSKIVCAHQTTYVSNNSASLFSFPFSTTGNNSQLDDYSGYGMVKEITGMWM